MINKATLLGRVGRKDNKTTKSGSEMTTLSIATNRRWKDSTGQKQEQTTWHNVHCFNKIADVARQYANVGDLIFIEGEIQNKPVEYEGEKKWMYSITAREIKLLPQGKKDDAPKVESHSTKIEDSRSPTVDFDDAIPF